MQFHLRPLLGLAAVVTLNLAVHDSLGYFKPLAFAGLIVAFALGLAAALLPDRRLGPAGGADGDLFASTATALLLTALHVNSIHLTYASVRWAHEAVHALAKAGFALCLIAVLWPPYKTLLAPIDRADLRAHRRGLIAGLIAVLAVIVGRIAVGIAYFRPATLVALTFLYGVAAWLFLIRKTAFRRESASDASRAAPLVVLALTLGLAMRGGILFASPDPIIDVFALMRDGADHLLTGRNPYAEDIQSPYGTREAIDAENQESPDPRPAGYPPHLYLIAAPFRAVDLDPRWANVACDIIAGAALYGVALNRGRPRAGLMAVLIWMFLPRTSVMIESAWYEPMVAALLGVGLWLTEQAGWRRWAGYVLVGLGLTAKQYGLPLLPALAWPHRANWRPLLLGLLAGGLVILPWLIWSPQDFLDSVLWKHLDRPSQHERALTIAAACYHATGMLPYRELLWAVAAGLIGVLSWRAPRSGAATALSVGTALLVFCLFHTQGFLNYFYLVQYLWLLGALGLLAPTGNDDQKLSP